MLAFAKMDRFKPSFIQAQPRALNVLLRCACHAVRPLIRRMIVDLDESVPGLAVAG